MAFWKRLEWVGFPLYPYTQWAGEAVGLTFRVNDGRWLLDPTPRYNRVEWSIDGVVTEPLPSPQEFITYPLSKGYVDFHLSFVMPPHDVYVQIKVCHGTSGYPANCNNPDAVIDGNIYALTTENPDPPTDPADPSGFTSMLEEYAPWIIVSAGIVGAALIITRRSPNGT